MRSFILKDCYISTLLPRGKLKKKKNPPKSFQSFPNMKASVKTFNKCKFSPAGCWNIDLWAEAGKFTPTDVERESHPRFHALRLIFLFEVAAGLASMKFIPVGRAYSKAFTRDRLREGKKKKKPKWWDGDCFSKDGAHTSPTCLRVGLGDIGLAEIKHYVEEQKAIRKLANASAFSIQHCAAEWISAKLPLLHWPAHWDLSGINWPSKITYGNIFC